MTTKRFFVRCKSATKHYGTSATHWWLSAGHLIQRAPVTLVLVDCVRLGNLQENGCDYSIAELSKLRRVAYVFGQSTRRFDISWELYAEAGTPEILEAIIGGIPKGTSLTKSYIASIRKQ
jgi:hypothetical protein